MPETIKQMRYGIEVSYHGITKLIMELLYHIALKNYLFSEDL